MIRKVLASNESGTVLLFRHQVIQSSIMSSLLLFIDLTIDTAYTFMHQSSWCYHRVGHHQCEGTFSDVLNEGRFIACRS